MRMTVVLIFLGVILVSCADVSAPQSQSPIETRLILIGGGAYPEAAAERLVDWSGGSTGSIAILGWASNSMRPQYPVFESHLRANGMTDIVDLPDFDGLGNDQEQIAQTVSRAGGIFVGGGSQEVRKPP